MNMAIIHLLEEKRKGNFSKTLTSVFEKRNRTALVSRPVDQTRQISLAYWAMVRSEENLPAEATFIKHLRAKEKLSL